MCGEGEEGGCGVEDWPLYPELPGSGVGPAAAMERAPDITGGVVAMACPGRPEADGGGDMARTMPPSLMPRDELALCLVLGAPEFAPSANGYLGSGMGDLPWSDLCCFCPSGLVATSTGVAVLEPAEPPVNPTACDAGKGVTDGDGLTPGPGPGPSHTLTGQADSSGNGDDLSALVEGWGQS